MGRLEGLICIYLNILFFDYNLFFECFIFFYGNMLYIFFLDSYFLYMLLLVLVILFGYVYSYLF